MRCESCGGWHFSSTEYNLESVRVPALQCAGCGVVLLDETLARSEAERVAVRRAIDARQAIVEGAVPSRATEAETLRLLHAARPVPVESGKFPAAEVPTESRIRKVSNDD
jgi:hypothetical protein